MNFIAFYILIQKNKDMKKLRRKNLDELREIMPVVNDQELRTYVGGWNLIRHQDIMSTYISNEAMNYISKYY
jgi:hypothetical protein